MGASRPVVIHPEESALMPSSPGVARRLFLDPEGRWVGWAEWIRNAAGDVSDWHHHAANQTYVYVIRGSLTIHFGPDGRESVLARSGDLVLIPSQTIHREATGSDGDLEAFVIRVGCEPERLSVESPAGASG